MRSRRQLSDTLRRIDGRSYPAYRDLVGSYELTSEVTLWVDWVSGDPFAAPSRVRLRVAGLLEQVDLQDKISLAAAEDFFHRRAFERARSTRRGSGRSGVVALQAPGPEVAVRSACAVLVEAGLVELRLGLGLPARGRRVLGSEAEYLVEDLVLLAEALTLSEVDAGELAHHTAALREQRLLRGQLQKRGLVAFVADGSRLPRASGVSTKVLPGAVETTSPKSLQVSLQGLNGPVVGLGVRSGITVIVGGGFHGKSTFLQAIQSGHLDFCPGDGRERVVSLPSVVKVRAEDGRPIIDVNISPFLSDLPGGRSTQCFSTEDASGSTSQAAAIMEAVEAGSRLLLIDEDTSATNLLVRDERMTALLPHTADPIQPFVTRVGSLHEQCGVSTILVMGGVADYLGVAQTVIALDRFVLVDVTERAHSLVPTVEVSAFQWPEPRRVFSPKGLYAKKIRARDHRSVAMDRVEIDLTAVEQVLDSRHAWTLGQAIRFIEEEIANGRRTLPQMLDSFDSILEDEGLDCLSPFDNPVGDLVWPRRFEVAAALNRFRSAKMIK